MSTSAATSQIEQVSDQAVIYNSNMIRGVDYTDKEHNC